MTTTIITTPTTLFLALILSFTSLATTITVKQDGTGDFTIIQDAVDASINGDTVLVWPGTYFENVLCNGKNITIGSLTLTTGDQAYISQTIIDGNHKGSCIYVRDCLDHYIINGFTLQNGSGTKHGSVSGGSIIAIYTKVDIFNCIITNNHAQGYGGGIYYYYSTGVLSNTTIKNNHAYDRGGGLMLVNSIVEFDTINKCNIYTNYASRGTDIYKLGDECGALHVVVDTFTVLNPDYYYLYSDFGFGNPEDDISFEINTEKIQSVTDDLYVALNGDNQNSGLTPSEPLRDISFALLKMITDSISPDTIHVANGVYTLSGGEKFPLNLKRNVSIEGENRDSTILDAENQIYLLHGNLLTHNYCISNLTIQHGNGDVISPSGSGGVICIANDNAIFKNVLIKENYGEGSGGGGTSASDGFVLDSVEFANNIGCGGFRVGWSSNYGGFYDTITFKNCKVTQNYPDYSPDMPAGGGICINGQTSYPKNNIAIFYNCLFTENASRNVNNNPNANALGISQSSEAYLINCTLADNISNNPKAAAIGVTGGSELHVYNSIIYNNEYAPAYMYSLDWTGEADLYINNSLVDGGEDAIEIYSSHDFLHYSQETNIDTDPLFYAGPDFPYNLSNNSPCIDAGTLNLPDWIKLPETDLAGNPRIVGETVDMGCYEWNPTVGYNEYQQINKEKEKLLNAAPNPFRENTTISVKIPKKCNIKLEAYNNYGQRVKVFMDGQTLPGTSQLVWHGDDYNRQPLPSGIYYIVMFVDGNEVESFKLIKGGL